MNLEKLPCVWAAAAQLVEMVGCQPRTDRIGTVLAGGDMISQIVETAAIIAKRGIQVERAGAQQRMVQFQPDRAGRTLDMGRLEFGCDQLIGHRTGRGREFGARGTDRDRQAESAIIRTFGMHGINGQQFAITGRAFGAHIGIQPLGAGRARAAIVERHIAFENLFVAGQQHEFAFSVRAPLAQAARDAHPRQILDQQQSAVEIIDIDEAAWRQRLFDPVEQQIKPRTCVAPPVHHGAGKTRFNDMETDNAAFDHLFGNGGGRDIALLAINECQRGSSILQFVEGQRPVEIGLDKCGQHIRADRRIAGKDKLFDQKRFTLTLQQLDFGRTGRRADRRQFGRRQRAFDLVE